MTDYSKQLQATEYYPLKTKLDPYEESILLRNFSVRYFYTAGITAQKHWTPKSENLLEVSTEPIEAVGESVFSEFTLDTYYKVHSKFIDSGEQKKFLLEVPNFFRQQIIGKGYFVSGQLAAIIIANHCREYRCRKDGCIQWV